MKRKQIFNLLSLICNVANVVLVTYAIISFFFVKDNDVLVAKNWECFRYFTIDSNVLMAITSIIVIVHNIKSFNKDCIQMPIYAKICKFVGTVAVTVTFLTVMFFLGPNMGYKEMLIEGNLYLHLICPLLAIISYILFETGNDFSNKYFYLGLAPTVIYGLIYLILVLITKTRPDFYGFNMNGLWYISLIAMIAATYGISIGLHKLNLLIGRKI